MDTISKIVAMSKCGDRFAQERLISVTEPIRREIISNLKSRLFFLSWSELAEDANSEMLIVLLKCVRLYDQQKGSFLAYYKTSAQHACENLVKREVAYERRILRGGRDGEMPSLLDLQADPDCSIDALIEREHLKSIARSIDPRRGPKIVQLRELGLTNHEIAKTIGMSYSFVCCFMRKLLAELNR